MIITLKMNKSMNKKKNQEIFISPVKFGHHLFGFTGADEDLTGSFRKGKT
jgi:hypothetical protein